MQTYPLHEAVLNANTEAVSVLIEMGASLNELDEQGHTPLHWAVFGGYDDIVEILLCAGANPNIFSGDGVTPKWRANDFGLLEIEKLLASYGGKIDTNENFNGIAFKAFNELMGLPLPQVERLVDGASQAVSNSLVSRLVQRIKQVLGISPINR